MQDEMMPGRDVAAYWIEYVIRHKGAPHLRTASRKLWLYQRGLLDVTAIVFVCCLLFGYVFVRFSRYCAGLIFIHAISKQVRIFSVGDSESNEAKKKL